MTATSESRDDNLPARLRIPAFLMVLGFVTTYCFVANGQIAMGIFWEEQGSGASGAFVFNLLLVGAIWALSWLSPSKGRAIAQLVLLAFAAFMVSGATVAVLKNLHARDYLGLWYWKTLGLIAANLLVIAGALWGIWTIRPLKALKSPGELISPATRRTKQLFGLSGVVSVLAVAVLIAGVGTGDGNPVWSNSRNIPPVVAMVATVIWLLSIALAWWWYRSADEHERRANDVGFLVGGGLFMAATPVWWIAARAGLAPPPDAMILWYATMLAMGIGWWWYRSR